MGVQELIAALPSIASGDEPNPDTLRTELVTGVVGFIPSAASVVSGVLQADPFDAELGGVRQAYVYGTDGGVFVFDENDTTTAHDGIYAIVLIGGRVYKRLGQPIIGAVISRTAETPPDPDDAVPENRPQFGDAYLFLTGAWAAEGIAVNSIAVWSTLGGGSWQEVTPRFGPPLYIQDEDGYVRWAGDDGWLDGVGSRAYPDDTIPLSAHIWDGRVQNQTTNVQPATISKGVAHIIGPLPTGTKWAGNAGKISISEAANDVTVYTPSVGMTVFDIALGIDIRWSGTAWVSAAGVWVGRTPVLTPGSGSVTAVAGNTFYAYSAGTFPTTSNRLFGDAATATHRAKRTGANLKITWTGDVTITSGSQSTTAGEPCIALFRGSETTAIAVVRMPLSKNLLQVYPGPHRMQADFFVDALNALDHIYKVCLTSWRVSGVGTFDVGTIQNRSLEVLEAA